MTGTGRVIQADLVNMPGYDDRPAYRVITDATEGDNAVYIAPDGPRPMDGTVISWTTGHVTWTDQLGQAQRARKLGYGWREGATRWAYSCPVEPHNDPAESGNNAGPTPDHPTPGGV